VPATITLRTLGESAEYEAQVELLGGFALQLQLDDGTAREVDLEAELWGPVFEPRRHEPELFRTCAWTRSWNDRVSERGDLDTDVLHSGLIPA
jgi:hypothetical protein